MEVEGGGFDMNEDLFIIKGGVVLGEGDEVEGFEEVDFVYLEGEGGVGIVRWGLGEVVEVGGEFMVEGEVFFYVGDVEGCVVEGEVFFWGGW